MPTQEPLLLHLSLEVQALSSLQEGPVTGRVQAPHPLPVALQVCDPALHGALIPVTVQLCVAPGEQARMVMVCDPQLL